MQVVGAAAGVATVVYFVGAMTIWVRLTTAHLPADAALGFISRSRVAALGVKGVLLVGVVVAPLMLLALWSLRHASGGVLVWLLHTRPLLVVGPVLAAGFAISYRLGWHQLEMFGSIVLVAVATAGIGDWVAGRATPKVLRWVLVVVVGCAILLSARVSWRGLGVVFALLASLPIVVLLAVRGSKLSGGKAWLSGGALLAAVGIAGLAWQIQAPINIDGVTLTPAPHVELIAPMRALLPGEGVPYLGETGSAVFVAEVWCSHRRDHNPTQFLYTDNVLEIPRSQIQSISFLRTPDTLRPPQVTPAELGLHWLTEWVHKVLHTRSSSVTTGRARPPNATRFCLELNPSSGPSGTSLVVTNRKGFAPGDRVSLTFTDSAGTTTSLGTATASRTGISSTVTVPSNAATGAGEVLAEGSTFSASAVFTVISSPGMP